MTSDPNLFITPVAEIARVEIVLAAASRDPDDPDVRLLKLLEHYADSPERAASALLADED